MICSGCAAKTETAPCAACGADPLLDGRYRLEEVLGRGAKATTYCATVDGRTVAVKESPLHWDQAAKATELAEREAAVLRQLCHPQIPAYVDSLVAGSGKARSLYLVQQFVQGEDLQQHLEAHRYTEREVLAVLRQLCEVLQYLHTLSPPVIHRDLKPKNVIRRWDGLLVLVDFGSVRDALRDADLGGSTVAGTFGYMAPEQFMGEATPKTDLYALGALAVALLTRRDPASLAGHDRRIQWRPHAQVSPAVGALLDELLALHPARRPASMEAVARRLDRMLAGQVAAVPAPPGAGTFVSVAPFLLGGGLVLSPVVLVVALAALGMVVAATLPATPTASGRVAPRWELHLPSGLEPMPIDRLFHQGQERMRDGDYRGALQDFYRVLRVDPDYPPGPKFAFATGEYLVLDVLEERLRARAVERAGLSGEETVAGADGRRETYEAGLAYAEDLRVRGRYDEATFQYDSLLQRIEAEEWPEATWRGQVFDLLTKTRQEAARQGAETWSRAVMAEARGDRDGAISLFLQLRQEHPTNPSVGAHLKRLER